MLNEFGNEVYRSTRKWFDWARRNVKELGENGIRQMERQDLLHERKKLVIALGEYAFKQFVNAGKKTLRGDSLAVQDILDRAAEINQRLEELDQLLENKKA